MRILIVEDENKTAAFVRKGLRESGFVADIAQDGEEGLFQALNQNYELPLLRRLPPRRQSQHRSGWRVYRTLAVLGVPRSVYYAWRARESLVDRDRIAVSGLISDCGANTQLSARRDGERRRALRAGIE